MKRFIIISLFAALSLPGLACGWMDTHNYYLFEVFNQTGFRQHVWSVCDDNWKAYLGKSGEDSFWFDADEIIGAARQKGDLLMVSYVENLQKYLDCCRVEQEKAYEWNYPSQEDLARQKADLQTVRTYALSKTNTRLRSQHALLYMRCNMLMGRHQENVTYWEQTASQLIETVYKDMMKNIYAGALYKTGREDEAGELFAEMGDEESLMTQYYRRRSFAAIKQVYLRNPKAKVLPFLLQDFVNNCQEAIDAENGEIQGKLFIRDITRQEAMQMVGLCGQAVSEGKTDVPILWQSAKAWMEYLYGDRQQAVQDILAAASLDGTVRMKECARELMLYITTAQAKPSEAFDDYLADELQWLLERKQNGDWGANCVMDRLGHQLLLARYADSPSRQAALKQVTCGDNQDLIDTLRVDLAEKYLTYLYSSGTNSLDRVLKQWSDKGVRQQLVELIGTKYMRICRWDRAIEWLQSVPGDFYTQKGYAGYAYNRRYDVEPWVKRQWLSDNIVYGDTKWQFGVSPKLVFAKEMQKLEGTINVLQGQAQQQAYYDLAVRYAQANFRGDCWWLMRDAKSVTDTVRVNETDLAAKAMELLRRAGETTDPALKEKVLFALAYGELYGEAGCWRVREWNEQTYDMEWRVMPQSPQYRAFTTLADFEKQGTKGPAAYVSRCDEYIQFRKQYR